MPRMDGWELARRMRRVAPSTPIVIMVSAANRAALAARLAGEAALVNGFLTKPATPAMLRDALAGASAAPLQPPPLALPASAARLAGVRVLVVDDIAMNRQIARGLLEHDGATVDEADGGVAALAMSAAHDYDAILMDVQMPDMDGYACTRAMRQRAGARIPVIAMTANVMASDREACLAAGMDDHVGKPIEIATLAAVLLRHCAAPAVPAVPAVPVVPAVPALAGTEDDAATWQRHRLRAGPGAFGWQP
jgi:CheY-like chemotaxis protein